MEPWRGLDYRADPLGRWLARAAREGEIWLARAAAAGPISGIIVVQGGFLLGSFVALVAVKPEQAGRGVGRALMEHVQRRVFARRRWLYVSADSGNRRALGFYRELGFKRVGRLPDLIRAGRDEILLRLGAPGAAVS
jgi:ribosomal protein S18 acetylase RimI-like enzyme